MRGPDGRHHRLALIGILATLAIVVSACGTADPSSATPTASAGPSGGPGASAVVPSVAPSVMPAEGDATKLLGPWRSVPLPAPVVGDTSSRAEAACRSAMLEADDGIKALAEARRVIADARGEASVWLVFATESAVVDCRAPLAEGLAIGEVELRLWEDIGPPPADDGIAYIEYGFLEDMSSGRTYALGRFGRQSVKVIATFRDESHAFASVGDGWYLVWWFGTTAPVGIGATDAHHLTIAAIAPPSPGP